MLMHLKKTPSRNGRTHLSIVEGRRDPKTGKVKKVTIKTLGYLDVLEKEYADHISHFTEIVAQMNAAKEEERAELTIRLDSTHRVSGNERKNVGYVALSTVYHELEIHKFLQWRQKSLDIEYNLNSIMRLLVFSRLLAPGSKKKAYDEREWFFERSDFTLVDMYRALSRFAGYGEALQLWMHERITAAYGRDTSTTYYDVTNYYFEIDKQDELRRKGVSKEHRPDCANGTSNGQQRNPDGVSIVSGKHQRLHDIASYIEAHPQGVSDGQDSRCFGQGVEHTKKCLLFGESARGVCLQSNGARR